MRWVRKFVWLLVIMVILSAIPAALMGVSCRGTWTNSSLTRERILDAVPASAADVEVSYLRDEARTYLTFPEWFIVYVSQDYGAWLEDRRPSGFPYFTAAYDFWKSYCGVTRVTTARYDFDVGTHVMIYVIGVSHSWEYIFKGIYENTLGRLFEVLASGTVTEEEVYAQEVAEDYGAFLNTTPWYEYPFFDKLQGLWSETSFGGDGVVRKWERKVVLSLEYLIKAGYGAAIATATGAAYAPAELEILLVTGPVPQPVLDAEPDVEVVSRLSSQQWLLQVPRYAAFTRLMALFANTGVGVQEIAGNGDILITALMPGDTGKNVQSAEPIFEMGIAIDDELKRVGYRVPVTRISDLLQEIDGAGGVFEHAYDY